MQTLQIYIGIDRIDLFDDETVSVTQTIRNAKDISKVFTTFSKQFTVPASKANNKIFKHYYNFTIDNGYDARLRKDSRIEINHVVFQKGRMKLDGVDMRNNKAYAYRITFYGNIVELKDILGEDKLPTLTTGTGNLNYEFNYDSTTTLNHLKTLTSTDHLSNSRPGVCIPLITHSQRLYYDSLRDSDGSGNLHVASSGIQGLKYNQLKYAVRLDKIIDAIEGKYSDINFASTSFFKASGTDISDLYMWCHRKKGDLIVEAGTEDAVDFGYSGYGNTYIDIGYTNNAIMKQNAAANHTLMFLGTVSSASAKTRYDLIIKKNGTVVKTYTGVRGTLSPTFTTGNFSQNDSFVAYIRTYEQNVVFDNLKWSYLVDGSEAEYKDSDQTTYYASWRFNIAEQMPEQKIIDFLSSLFKMFNLVAYVNDNDEIEVQPLDDYYTTTQHDISEYVSVETSKVDVALPFKEIFFKYKDTKTIVADNHLQAISNVEWGGNEYTDPENIYGEIYKVEPDFHHMKFEKIIDASDSTVDTGIQWGYFVDDDENSYLGKPLILYIDPTQANVNFSYATGADSETVSTTVSVNMPSNTKVINNASSDNIHFDSERSEYTLTEATQSLFERYYKNYIVSVFDKSNRLSKVTAYLPARMILDIKLSDIIVINNTEYRINSMKTNLRDGKTEFELLNI